MSGVAVSRFLPLISGLLTAIALVFGVGSKSCTGHFSIGEGLYWLVWITVGGGTPALAVILALLLYGTWRLALRKWPERAGTVLPGGLLLLPVAALVLSVLLTPHHNDCIYI